MIGRFVRGACAALAVCAALAAPAAGAPSGEYSGVIHQTNLHYTGEIKFIAQHNAIVALAVKMTVICTDGNAYSIIRGYNIHLKLKRKGSFKHEGDLGSQGTLDFTGRIKGRSATGTIQIAFNGGSHGGCTNQQFSRFSASR